MIRYVKIKDIQEGMVLGKPLEDDMGRVLLRAGERLSARFVGRLEAWGILEVPIEVHEEAPAAAPAAGGDRDPKSESQVFMMVDLMLEERFAPHKGNAIMETIRRAARRTLVAKKTGKKSV